jgi:hypothetical protein
MVQGNVDELRATVKRQRLLWISLVAATILLLLVNLDLGPLFDSNKLFLFGPSTTFLGHYATLSHSSKALGSRGYKKVLFEASAFPNASNAIVIIAYDLTEQALELSEQIQSYSSDNIDTQVFLLVDSVTTPEAIQLKSNVYVVSTGEDLPKRRGFRMTDGFNIRKEVHGWDKFYYMFAHVLLHKYKFVWAIEWDVFVPSKEAFLSLLASSDKGDFISMGNWANTNGVVFGEPVIKNGRKKDNPLWHWKRVKDRMPLPWHGTMMCAHGSSERLLASISEYAVLKRRLEFIEIFAITLAVHNNFTIYNSPQLSTVLFRNTWACDDVKKAPMNLFHPVKNRTSLLNCL